MTFSQIIIMKKTKMEDVMEFAGGFWNDPNWQL